MQKLSLVIQSTDQRHRVLEIPIPSPLSAGEGRNRRMFLTLHPGLVAQYLCLCT